MKRRPRKDPLLGGFMLVDADNIIVAGADPVPFSLDLGGVKRVLAGSAGGQEGALDIPVR